MLLFDERTVINFKDYGITIPSLFDRKKNAYDYLVNLSEIKDTSDEWAICEFENIISPKDLYCVHIKEYIDDLFNSNNNDMIMKAYELIDENGNFNRYDPESAVKDLSVIKDQLLHIVSGTYKTIEQSFKNGFAYFLSGGMHHAHPSWGHGFCPVNDIAASAQMAINNNLASKIWIIDVDAHFGDGTADIFSNSSNTATLSIHMAKGWPLDIESVKRSFHSDIDIPVNSGDEDDYNFSLEKGLMELKDIFIPDMAIVVAGVDPHRDDMLESTSLMKLSDSQLLQRDLLVYNFLKKNNIPSAWLAAGGYGPKAGRLHSQFLEIILKELYSQI